MFVFALALAFWLQGCQKEESTSLSEESSTGQTNLFGKELQKCDRSTIQDEHFPTTGFQRGDPSLADKCTATKSDQGSHYICADLPDAVDKSHVRELHGGKSTEGHYSPFWTETGQAKNASQAEEKFPKPGPWCICMWAFAAMLEKHADFVKMVDCKSTQSWVITNYDINVAEQRDALKAICDHCQVDAEATNDNLKNKCKQAKEASSGSSMFQRHVRGQQRIEAR